MWETQTETWDTLLKLLLKISSLATKDFDDKFCSHVFMIILDYNILGKLVPNGYFLVNNI